MKEAQIFFVEVANGPNVFYSRKPFDCAKFLEMYVRIGKIRNKPCVIVKGPKITN